MTATDTTKPVLPRNSKGRSKSERGLAAITLLTKQHGDCQGRNDDELAGKPH